MSAVTVSETGSSPPPVAPTAPVLSLVPDPGPLPAQVVPCVARPSTPFVHLDGACRCFVGGPAPELPSVP